MNDPVLNHRRSLLLAGGIARIEESFVIADLSRLTASSPPASR